MTKKSSDEKQAKAEILIRFVQAINNNERPDPEALSAGIFTCIEKIQKLRSTTGPKPRQQHYIDTPQFMITQQHVAGELTYGEAVDRLADLCCVEKRTAEKDFAEMKPRAEIMAEQYAIFREINRKN